MIAARKIRVLIVDDSAVVRRAISDALSRDPEIEVAGTACDPYVARDKILELNPDVMTLDIEMPRMDGLTFLRVLQQHRPIPVVVVSSLTQAGSSAALAALDAGAVDVLAKPGSAWSIGNLGEQLAHRVKGAARARFGTLPRTVAAPDAPPILSAGKFNPRQLVVLGASTGGTEAIKRVLTQLPAGLPGICIVQHIPAVFSKAFADRLNDCCAMEVREAAHGDEVKPGRVLIAPGDYHMALEWNGGHYTARLHQGPPLHYTRPAVDVLFNSAAACAGSHAVTVLLTGMGSDGAQGMKKLKAAGSQTIAQDESTCVVYGMPRAAVDLGVVDKVLPLDNIPSAIIRALEYNSHTIPRHAPTPESFNSTPAAK
ncbi:MAG TPA: chemotaxis response regulator protein-glutamate methylesterase [Verrucomicrobiae bacterium]|nr:chemotaxis response regulator protein-glutamate methylesterase [Verrucomicrobiae bacterium]